MLEREGRLADLANAYRQGWQAGPEAVHVSKIEVQYANKRVVTISDGFDLPKGYEQNFAYDSAASIVKVTVHARTAGRSPSSSGLIKLVGTVAN